MSNADKAKNTAQKAGGHVKETVGRGTGNESLKAEGVKDQAAGDVKNAGEHVKDAGSNVKNALKH